MVSEAPFFLGLSVRGLFMTGNCSRTWLVTASCRYGNSSLTPLKIDPLHPWDRKIKENQSRGGPVCSAAGPHTDFEVQSHAALGVSFNCPPKSKKGWAGSGRSNSCWASPAGGDTGVAPALTLSVLSFIG